MMAFQKDEGNRSVIKHKQYGDDEWKTDDFHPYFYVDAGEGYGLPGGVSGHIERSVGPNAYDGTELHRVVLDQTRDVKDARQVADNHYEADIPYERRWFIDNVEGSMAAGGDINEKRPHVMHLDIEVYADGGSVDALAADQPVISVSGYSEKYDSHIDFLLKPDGWSPDSYTDEKGRECIDVEWSDDPVFVFDTETAMLGALARVMKRSGVEVVTGWNVEGFDITYLIKRVENLPGIVPAVFSPLQESYVSTWTTDDGNQKTNATIKGVDVFDMMLAYKHLKRRDKPPNWRLGTVAEYEGTEVGKMPFDTARVGPIWEDDPVLVMEYNHRDAVLTHHIAEALGVFDLFLEMHRAFAMPLPDTLKNSVLVEMYVMSRSPAWGITDRILDSKRSVDNEFEGGNTKKPHPGLYEWVFSADVTSEYPNWVRAANLSPETVVTPDDEEWGRDDLISTPSTRDGLPVKFLPHDERLGILPRAVDEMFRMKAEKTEKRAQYDYGTPEYEQADMERDATKWFLNSIQGVTGMETHRLSKPEVSAAITAFGRDTVETMVTIGESLGYSFVYGDTDSAFFTDRDGGVDNLDAAVEAVERLAEETNERLPEWAEKEFGITDERRFNLEVEPEKVAKRAFFPNKKKRYTLWLAWNDGERVDKISHTGWAIVRSDTSELEYRAQKKTLEALMHNRSERFVTRKLGEEMERVVDGEYDLIELARPQGSSKAFASYGANNGQLDFENVPYFVAAMMSSNELLGTDYKGGDKTWMLPVTGGATVEVNNSTNNVNYLAIEDDTELPDGIRVDYKKVLDNIIGKVERVYDSLGWDLSALRERRDDARGKVEVRRTQENNHTLGAFSS